MSDKFSRSAFERIASPEAVAAFDKSHRQSAAEEAAYDAGLVTAKKLAASPHQFSIEYSTVAIVQDALQAYRHAVTTKTP